VFGPLSELDQLEPRGDPRPPAITFSRRRFHRDFSLRWMGRPPRIQALHVRTWISLGFKDHILGREGPDVVGNVVRATGLLSREAFKDLTATFWW
jgi:hypothetical protein